MLHSKKHWARSLALTLAAVASLKTGLYAQDATKDETLASIVADIEREQQKLPRTHQSVAAVLAEIGKEPTPESIHAWVRKNIRAVDYAGSLRDVDGVLADRTGNSLDRSLLLAKLLSQSGWDVKIVGADQASPVEAVPEDNKPRELDADETKARAIAADLNKFVDGVKPASAVSNRHWWVQYDQGQNKWVDLDPALEPGKQMAKPSGKELDLDSRTQSVVVPAELKYRVMLVLQVERWENGKLAEAPALKLALDDPKQAALVSSRMMFQPFNPKTEKVFVRDDANAPKLKASLLSETAWCPVIIEGSTSGKLAKVFDDAGIVANVPRGMSGAEEIGRAVTSGIGGLMGGTTGDNPDKPAEKPTVLSAVFADYVITAPGAEPKTVRRPVFDTLGPAQREAAAKGNIDKPKWTDEQRLARGVELNAIHSTVVARAAVDFDGYVARYAQRVIDAKPLIEESQKGPLDEKKSSRLADQTSFNSLELFAAQRSTASNSALYVAEPQIYRRIVALVPGSADALTLRATSDLAWNPLRTTTDANRLIEAGVLDTLRESAVTMSAATSPDQSTAVLIDAAQKAGASLKLAKAVGDLGDLQLPPDAAARIRADLSAGQWVVYPSQPVVVANVPRIGWWRVDPKTLQTVGVMDTGYLQNTIEYTETHEVNGIQITKFGRMKVSDAAHVWAREVIKRRGNTSWNQWINLLKLAQKTLNATGGLPPL